MKIGMCESNISTMTYEMSRMQTFVSQHSGSEEITEDNIDDLVYAKDDISTKLIHLWAKQNSYDDAMNVVKKCYSEDKMGLKDMLNNVRNLSSKQFKTIFKIKKVQMVMSGH